VNITGGAQCASEWLLGLLLLGSATSGRGQMLATKTVSQDATTIRVWGVGSGTHAPGPLLGILAELEHDYRNDHPTVKFVNTLRGNDSALGGIYVGAADIALMDREPSYIELDGYQQVITGQKPFMAAFMRGGIERSGHSSPLVVIVNRRNPIETLTVVQLETIFSAADSFDRHARLWSDIGLKGAWADRPLRLYGFGVETSESRTFSGDG
jgi:phosphate transport system substrate-binding protein